MGDPSEVAELREFVARLLTSAGRCRDFSDDQSLFTSGLLDSIAAMELITHLERRHNLRVDASFSIMRVDSFLAILKVAQIG